MNLRYFHLYLRRLFLYKQTFCIISNNCVSGTIYSDMKKQYISPTIWVHMDDTDFIRFSSNLKYYLKFELKEYTDSLYKDSICGYLGEENPVHMHFFHNNTFDSAKNAWDRRASRLSLENIYIIWSSKSPRDEDILSFKSIHHCRNKILLTSKHNKKNVLDVPHKYLSYFDSSLYFSGYELEEEKWLFFFRRRRLDRWNYTWFFRK